MIYKAQFLVPVVLEFDAPTDEEAEKLVDEISTRELVRRAVKQDGLMGSDVGCHALIREDGSTVFET